MSDEQVQTSSPEVQPEKGSNQEVKQVSEKAFKEVSGDMHKYKAKAKDLDMRLTEMKATLEAQQKAKLEEEKQFEELYRKSEQDKAQLLSERAQEKQLFVDAVKKSALKTELGGNIRDQYLNLAGFDEIELNDDGSLNSESVRSVANKFKQDHPALVPSSASGTITSQASPIDQQLASKPKTLGQLTYEEKEAMLVQMKQSKS